MSPLTMSTRYVSILYEFLQMLTSQHSFFLQKSEKARAVKVLYHLFSTKKMSITLKSKVLSMMIQLLSKQYEEIPFQFSWQSVWNEVMDLILRENKCEDTAGSDSMQSYVYRLVSSSPIDSVVCHNKLTFRPSSCA
jgi:hypothetical protein